MKNNWPRRKSGELVAELHNEVDRVDKGYRRNVRITKQYSRKRLILKLYQEVLIILDRIVIELQSLDYYDRQIEQLQPTSEGSHKLRQGTRLYDSAIAKFRIIELLTVDVKSLFHWCFTIDELLGKGVLPKNITGFRNIFLTHFPEKIAAFKKMRRLVSGKTSGKDDFRLDFIPFRKKSLLGFSAIERQVLPFLPEITKEKNKIEKINIIWADLDKLPATLQSRRFLDSLAQFGIQSPPLKDVVKVLLFFFKQEFKRYL